jgi:hypothetical protein
MALDIDVVGSARRRLATARQNAERRGTAPMARIPADRLEELVRLAALGQEIEGKSCAS